MSAGLALAIGGAITLVIVAAGVTLTLAVRAAARDLDRQPQMTRPEPLPDPVAQAYAEANAALDLAGASTWSGWSLLSHTNRVAVVCSNHAAGAALFLLRRELADVDWTGRWERMTHFDCGHLGRPGAVHIVYVLRDDAPAGTGGAHRGRVRARV